MTGRANREQADQPESLRGVVPYTVHTPGGGMDTTSPGPIRPMTLSPTVTVITPHSQRRLQGRQYEVQNLTLTFMHGIMIAAAVAVVTVSTLSMSIFMSWISILDLTL